MLKFFLLISYDTTWGMGNCASDHHISSVLALPDFGSKEDQKNVVVHAATPDSTSIEATY